MMEQIHELAGAIFCADTSSLNPQTGATIEIAACKQPAFKAGKALKDSVN